jgi:hypothetical protein
MHFGKLEIKFDLIQKKSPFLMTFLFAPSLVGCCNHKAMIERKLLLSRQAAELVLKFN